MATGSIKAIVDRHLCSGCGACLVACPAGAVRMVSGQHYDYAKVDARVCTKCGLCLELCPQNKEHSDAAAWGATEPLGCYLAHASDEAVRREGASGGFITALLAHLLEQGAISGAVVVRARTGFPFVGESFLARSREEVVSARGSRYAPVSVCAALAGVREQPGRYAFVGKPCEIRALRNLQRRFSEFRDRVVLAVGLFCAQTPARSRTKELLERRGIDPQQVRAIAYRGAGWPGQFRAWNRTSLLCEMPYGEAWGYLANGAPAVACLLCPDGVASGADVSGGDPWPLVSDRPMGDGRTWVAVWTEAGRLAVTTAARAGAIIACAVGDGGRMKLGQARSLRMAAAGRRLSVYRAVAGGRRSLAQLLKSRLTCLPTLLWRCLSRAYY